MYEDVTKESFAKKRKELREKLITQQLLNNETPLSYTMSFSGSGDSGQANHDSGSAEVDELLDGAIELYVTFDWYNNDGGGGDLTWDVVADKIIINGYQHETISHDVMTEEEF